MKALPLTFGVALGILTGCGKPAPVPSSAPLVEKAPAERVAVDGKELTASGISLTFPTDWQTVSMTQGEFDDALKGLEKNPRGPEMVQAVKAAAQSGMIKMFAFDPKSSKPGFMNNANLVVQKGVGNVTLDQALDASKRQLEAMGAKITTSKVTFPAGEFGRMESRLKGPNGIDYVAIGYMNVGGGDLVAVTFSCGPESVKEFDAKAQGVMKTFVRK